MFKKVATYTDYNGVERTETFYFNLTQAEVLEMELSTTGGLSAMIQGLMARRALMAVDSSRLLNLLKLLLRLRHIRTFSWSWRRMIRPQPHLFRVLRLRGWTNTQVVSLF